MRELSDVGSELMDARNELQRRCNSCKFMKRLEKYDYSNGGCVHTEQDGFACMAFCSEGVVIHMVGVDPESGYCECYSEKGKHEEH